MKNSVVLLLLVAGELSSKDAALALTTKSKAASSNNFLADAFGSIFSGGGSKARSSAGSKDEEQRKLLKSQLLDACNKSKNKNSDREQIETLMYQLAEMRPIQATASDPALQKLWKLEWTSEKEINFFKDVGICTGDITQLIDGSVLENNIPWRNGGLGVIGDLTVTGESNPIRTEFEFQVAKLDFGSWGTYELPPVGKGWFDTIYLDDELRVDTNSRDDILICTPL